MNITFDVIKLFSFLFLILLLSLRSLEVINSFILLIDLLISMFEYSV